MIAPAAARARSKPGAVVKPNTHEELIMNKDQVKGRVKQAEGKLKEVAGKVVGNRPMESEGKTEKAAGKIQSAYGDLKSAVDKKR